MFKVGDYEIQLVYEINSRMPATHYDRWSPEILTKYPDIMKMTTYAPDKQDFPVTIGSWVVKSPRNTIIIDGGVGNDKERPTLPHMHQLKLPYLADLAKAGVKPEDVDTVITTHIHSDHVGWNTRLVNGAYVPTFPNAKYFVSGVEYDARDPKKGAAQKPPTAHLPFLDSVLPIKEAGKLTMVEGDEQLMEGVDLVKIPGHSPGQMGVRLRSKGQEAFFVADVFHQPIQVFFPEWRTKYCELQDLAVETRLRVVNHCADTGALMLPMHFGPPYAGYVKRAGSGYRFEWAKPEG